MFLFANILDKPCQKEKKRAHFSLVSKICSLSKIFEMHLWLCDCLLRKRLSFFVLISLIHNFQSGRTHGIKNFICKLRRMVTINSQTDTDLRWQT